ncbi:neutral cholesterol ester hydrolase 1-like isoform X2 [Paramormyrops kingsleyae]|uniref:neutral cholesterol ester hydrolase 1-like isoform X2 n=1 Tax=Paramormyrops kingsleyae TaxID=1676925 RepID=UPI000CD63856|nr:neutral cholesterol ester hydrolase 1-like isoform X2 [Paramormyrops kingsleyae]
MLQGSHTEMHLFLVIAFFLTVATAYYIYTPLPSAISEPWKVMLLDAGIRFVVKMGYLVDDLGLSHHTRVLNFAVDHLEVLAPHSSEGVSVSDTVFAGLQVRVFESTRELRGQLKRGLLYFHGGGWAIGSGRMRSYDQLCRRMAQELDAVIVSVDYRLAPDVVFPGQYHDAIQAAWHFLQPEVLARYSVDPGRVGVTGDSAGANLGAAVAHEVAMDSQAPIKFRVQALIYPVLQALDFNTPSYQQNQAVPILYRPLMARFWLEYLGGDPSYIQPLLANDHAALDVSQLTSHRDKLNWTRLLPATVRKNYEPVVPLRGSVQMLEELPGLTDPRAAPLLAEQEVLTQAPPTYILTCEHDVLRDDGLMYGRRLEEAGVAVSYDHHEDGFHGCLSFAFWPAYLEVGIRCVQNYICWLGENL